METSPLLHQNPNSHHHLPPPKPITRSEPGDSYPATFVQADSSSFKQVVQMLTGSSDLPPPQPSKIHIPPIKSNSNFKLYERRYSHKNLKINPLNSFIPSPRKPEILSPSILDFPSLVLRPVTPMIHDTNPVDRLAAEAEDKAIKEKGFYFHPSPATTPGDSEPRLLPLFPVTSPRVPGFSSTA